MSKSFDSTVQLVSARLSNSVINIDKEGGKAVAAYIHEIYKELSAIERAEDNLCGYKQKAVELKD